MPFFNEIEEDQKMPKITLNPIKSENEN